MQGRLFFIIFNYKEQARPLLHNFKGLFTIKAFSLGDEKDAAMKKWLAVMVALGIALLMAGAAFGAEVKVEGVIANWKDLKDRVPASAYFQLVRYSDKLKGTSDQEGYAAFDSKLPKIKVRDDGSFKLSVKDLPSGNYFIALQRSMPKEVYGEVTAAAIPLLITEKQEALVIRVPGTFPLNVGRVFVAVRGQPQDQGAKSSEKSQEAPPAPPSTEK